MLTIQTSANRHYVCGNTYPVREHLRIAGLRWDPVAKAWWTSDRAVADRAVAAVNKTQSPASTASKADASTVKKAAPRKRCWECGCLFTQRDARIDGGDWGDSYCGC